MIRVCVCVWGGMQHRGCGNTGMLNFNFRLKDGGGGVGVEPAG